MLSRACGTLPKPGSRPTHTTPPAPAQVLPWLWRLADEQGGTPDASPAVRGALLDALATCPAAEDVQIQEKVHLLHDTLAAVWSHAPGGRPRRGRRRPGGEEPRQQGEEGECGGDGRGPLGLEGIGAAGGVWGSEGGAAPDEAEQVQ